MLGDLPIEKTLEVGSELLPVIGPEQAVTFFPHLVSRALVEARPDDDRVAQMLASPLLRIPSSQIVPLVASRSASPARVGSNLTLIQNTPPELRRELITRIDELSDRLVHRNGENLGAAAYRAWASLIADSGVVDRALQLQASIPTLAFAMRHPHLPVSTLVRTAFPVVYEQLLRSKGEEDFSVMPRLIMLPMSFFVDWDRAKSARHELVDVSLRSSWPPSDLLLTAIDAGIDRKVLKRLAGSSRGSQYIRSIEKESRQLSERDGAKIRASFVRSGF